jgi:tellurite resistance protein TehA-like permease
MGRALDAVPPAVGAEVMGTAIVSIGLALDGQALLSDVLLVIATGLWVTFGALLPLRAVRDPATFRVDAGSPAALTSVIATAVLGTRITLLGWRWAGLALLLIAFMLWLALQGPVLADWESPVAGISLLLAVSSESLAVLAATLAAAERAGWLLLAALVPLGLGLVTYAVVIYRLDLRQLALGRGDHWITGGALGISALAAARIADASHALDVIGGGAVLKWVALGLWVLTMLWLVALLFAEARWPRLGYDARRWSTVFPLGMYAAVSFVVGAVAHQGWISTFARVWVWVGFASWAVVLAATVRHATRVRAVAR